MADVDIDDIEQWFSRCDDDFDLALLARDHVPGLIAEVRRLRTELAAVVPAIRTQVAEEIAAAIGAATPDLTCTEVDRRTHGIRPGLYIEVNHAWRVAQARVAPEEEARG